MSYLSEILTEENGLPKDVKKEVSICMECGNKIEKGGMWATQNSHLGICKDCASALLDFYIDTLLDTQEIDENDDIGSIKRLTSDIVERYERKKSKKIKYNKKHM